MRTMPCTPISAKRSASAAHSASGATRSPLRALLDRLQDAGDRRHRLPEIGPEVGAAGDALLGLDVDQQQRRLGDAAAARAEHIGHRHFDADRRDRRGPSGPGLRSMAASRQSLELSETRPEPVWPQNRDVLESLTRGTHIGTNGSARRLPFRGVPRGPRQSRLKARALKMSRVPSLSSPFLIGFDQIERALDRVAKGADGYPPYNIERLAPDESNPERLRITLAVAGFTLDQLEVTVEEKELSSGGVNRRTRPALPASRHRRPPIPAHVRAGGRHGGAERRPEERTALDRSGAARARTRGPDDPDRGARVN